MSLLFRIDKNNKLTKAEQIDFSKEKEIQTLIEKNLDVVFNCKFIAKEFFINSEHTGRIDTLALSEDNDAPVIIEYKKVASYALILQSLSYLSRIKKHKGDVQIAVNNTLGKHININWKDARIICIAPEYQKFDLPAVEEMGANIELWQYKYYATNTLYLEEIFKKTSTLIPIDLDEKGKNPVMVVAGKKATLVKKTASYTFEKHLDHCDENIKEIFQDLQDFILGIDDSVVEIPKKFYVAYKVSQNFVCVETRKNKILLFLKIDPIEAKNVPNGRGRNMSKIGHYGTGDLEITITNTKDFEVSKKYIKRSFENIGG